MKWPSRSTWICLASFSLPACDGGHEKWSGPPLVAVPAGQFVMGSPEARPPQVPRVVEVRKFFMGRREITVEEWVAWLNEARPPMAHASPQIVGQGKRFTPARGRRRHPAAWIAPDEAHAYCLWLGQKTGRRVRLPTECEWEYAARGGLDGARFPWGWGPPEGRACFGAEGPRPVGSFPPNPFGLQDMAGNVFEWCVSDDAPDAFVARGGSWAERDARFLRVYNRVRFPRDYRNADVGFRIVVEEDPP